MKIVEGKMMIVDEISSLFNQYRMFYGQTSDLEGAKEFIRERIEKKESHIFIAYEGEKAAGFIQLYPTFTSVGMKRAFILNDLFVDPDFRKKGIGKALMQEAFRFCEKEKARYVSLQTSPDNHSAKALYEEMGMHIDNEYDSYIKYF